MSTTHLTADQQQKPSKISAVIRSMRPPFLILSPICVLVGVAMAMQLHQQFNGQLLTLVLIGAVSAHISVNAFNEFFDFSSGLDNLTVKTPFSGGSGGLPDVPSAHKNVLILGGSALILMLAGMLLEDYSHKLETYLTICGSVLIIIAHIKNIRHCHCLRKKSCSH